MVELSESTIGVERAAKLAQVSVRTILDYIEQGKLVTFRRDDGELLLRPGDVLGSQVRVAPERPASSNVALPGGSQEWVELMNLMNQAMYQCRDVWITDGQVWLGGRRKPSMRRSSRSSRSA